MMTKILSSNQFSHFFGYIIVSYRPTYPFPQKLKENNFKGDEPMLIRVLIKIKVLDQILGDTGYHFYFFLSLSNVFSKMHFSTEQ